MVVAIRICLSFVLCFSSITAFINTKQQNQQSLQAQKKLPSNYLRSTNTLQATIEKKSNDILLENLGNEDQKPLSEYSWKKQWYAVTYGHNFPKVNDKKPYSYSVFDQELTFWRDEQEVIRCSEDRCPHRNARLSEGRYTLALQLYMYMLSRITLKIVDNIQ